MAETSEGLQDTLLADRAAASPADWTSLSAQVQRAHAALDSVRKQIARAEKGLPASVVDQLRAGVNGAGGADGRAIATVCSGLQKRKAALMAELEMLRTRHEFWHTNTRPLSLQSM